MNEQKQFQDKFMLIIFQETNSQFNTYDVNMSLSMPQQIRDNIAMKNGMVGSCFEWEQMPGVGWRARNVSLAEVDLIITNAFLLGFAVPCLEDNMRNYIERKGIFRMALSMEYIKDSSGI